MRFVITVILLTITLFINGSNVLAKDENVGIEIEMLSWEKVHEILPKYSKFTVLDVETGKKFKVQRRAGNRHADVQPLTSKDTKIMKEIYGGKWSWKRRAIIVIHRDRWVAASMHGVPHGAGALDNNFPGHFCIHFYGSTTHRTNYMDLSHKLMILKAAARLEEYIKPANPYEVIQVFFAGLKEQDPFILSTVSLQPIKNKTIKKIEAINLERMPVLPAEDHLYDLSINIPVEINIVVKNEGGKTIKGSIELGRFSQMDSWKVDALQFFQQTNVE